MDATGREPELQFYKAVITNVNQEPLPNSLIRNWPDSSGPEYKGEISTRTLDDIIEDVRKCEEQFSQLLKLIGHNKNTLINSGQIVHDGLVRLLAEITNITSQLVISYQIYSGLTRLVQSLDQAKKELEKIPWT